MDVNKNSFNFYENINIYTNIQYLITLIRFIYNKFFLMLNKPEIRLI